MKPFESFLAPQLNDYLSYREGLGYAPQPCTDHLLRFDRYLHHSGADLGSLHPSFFLHMRTNLTLQASLGKPCALRHPGLLPFPGTKRDL